MNNPTTKTNGGAAAASISPGDTLLLTFGVPGDAKIGIGGAFCRVCRSVLDAQRKERRERRNR